jgi:hypothetical protein
MKTNMIILVAVIALFGPQTRAEDEESGEKIVSVSPDKKFAVRISYDPTSTEQYSEKLEGGILASATQGLELVTMPDKEVVLDLRDQDEGALDKAAWSQDSKWFAYGLWLGQRVTETRVCRRKGDKFEKLNIENLSVESGGDTRNQYIRPIKWLVPGTLVLEQDEIFRGGAGDFTIQFTVKFDDQGKFKVISKKKGKSKS